MGLKEGNKYHEYDSMFMGAIFMANKETKLECLKRKLFGLPLSKASFMKQIKAGMLLFLFEHEERKLYGVFEATSDGAMNIIPNAYISSGKSFPAQVLFRRLWMCKPLLEDEFHDAIKENYFSHNKFNFGLSYEQRIRLDLHRRQERPNNIITEFEMSGGDKGQVTGEASYLEATMSGGNNGQVTGEARYLEATMSGGNKGRVTGEARYLEATMSGGNKGQVTGEDRYLEATGGNMGQVTGDARYLEASLRERSTNNCVDLEKYTGLSIANTDYPSYEKRFTTGQSSLGSIGCESYQMAPLGIERHSSFSGHPTFPRDQSMRSNFPRFGGRVPSDTLGRMEDPPLPQKYITWIPSSTDVRIPHGRSEIHSWHADPNDYNYSSHNNWPSHFTAPKTSNVRFPSVGLEGQPNPGKQSTHERYDPSKPRISFSRLGNAVDTRMESLPSMCDPSNVEDHPAATKSQFDSSEQQCWDLGPSSDYIPLPRDNSSNRNRLSFQLNSPERDLSDCSYSESEEDDDYDELRPYPPTHANKYHLTGTNSWLHSDAEHGRASVFSRLSKVSERRKKHEYRRQDSRVTLDQLVELVSQRREEIIKARDRSTICNDDKQSTSIVKAEPNKAGFLDDMLNSSYDAVDEESVEVPFMKFKRRSEIRKTAGKMEPNAYVDSGENKVVLGKNKRRKLVRPSLNDECQTLNVTSAETVEILPLVEVGERIAEKVVQSPDPNLTDAKNICEKDKLVLSENGEPFPDPNPGYLTSSTTNGEKIGEKDESSLEHHGSPRSIMTENVTEASSRDRVQVSN